MIGSKFKKYFKQRWTTSKYFKYTLPCLGVFFCGFVFSTIYGFVEGIKEHNQYILVDQYYGIYNVYKKNEIDNPNSPYKTLFLKLDEIFTSNMSIETFNQGVDNYEKKDSGFKKDLKNDINNYVLDSNKDENISYFLKTMDLSFYCSNTKFSIAWMSLFFAIAILYMTWFYIIKMIPGNDQDIVALTLLGAEVLLR